MSRCGRRVNLHRQLKAANDVVARAYISIGHVSQSGLYSVLGVPRCWDARQAGGGGGRSDLSSFREAAFTFHQDEHIYARLCKDPSR